MSHDETTVYSVSELNNAVRDLLEGQFAYITVQGELSNFACPASGHWYFSLKDDKAQIRCAMFRGANRLLGFQPSDGTQILARAKVSLYAPRGDYQLIVEFLEEAGDGALRRAFELLKQKLAKAGLFAEKNKKPLPEFPKTIGIVTSSTGAALHDILKVLRRRCPLIPVIIYPTLVQGDLAAANIARMIARANEDQQCDVLIVARGGGSLEDLWAFNEEVVAHAIFNSQIPIVSGVGHEVDVTIADFVADVRAPTPSAAAEIVSPNTQEWQRSLLGLHQQLQREWRQILNDKKQQLLWLMKRLRHPKQKLQEQAQQLDYLWQNLCKAQRFVLHQQKNRLSHLSRALNTISPLATIDRGYSILQKNTRVIRSIQELAKNDTIQARLRDGVIDCEVIGLKKL